MTRDELEEFIISTYNVKPEYLWERYPTYSVFRHMDNSKWFAVSMTVPRSKFEADGAGYVDVVNLKCAMEVAESLREEPGIWTAYHMNKKHWISVALDGSVSRDTVEWLVSLSYKLTSKCCRSAE